MPEPRVGVIIDTSALPGGLDATAVCHLLAADEGVAAVAAVCDVSLDAVRGFVESNHLDGLVVAGLDVEIVRRPLGELLRKSGRSPFSLRLVDIEWLCAHTQGREEATGKAFLLLLAAVARVRRQRPIGQANLRPRFGPSRGRVTRREMFSLATLRYDVVPAVDAELCAAWRGCALCVRACPFAAVDMAADSARIDKTRCRDCGLCLCACPTGAIRHPLYLAEALDAELSVLLRGRPAPYSRLVAFACRSAMLALRKADRGSSPWRDGILPMEVPCLGALGWFLPLRAFDLGAEVVALLGCSAACQYGFDPAAVEAPLAATRRLLDAWAVGSERLVAINGDSPTTQASALASLADQIAALPPQPLATGEPVAADEHRYELAPLIRAMHRRLAGDPALCLGFEGMPLGLVTVDSERCSACGLCARHCPTQALTVDEKDEAFSLTHRAELCTACGLCAEVCPEEGAIQVEQRLDIARLTASPEIVKTDRLLRCRRCGAKLAPAGLIAAVRSRLPGEGFASMGETLCPDCRILGQTKPRSPASPPLRRDS